MTRTIALLAVLICAWVTLAGFTGQSHQKLVTIRNDRNSDVHTMSVTLDPKGRVSGLFVQTQHNDTSPPTVTSRSFLLSDISSPGGVVLDGDGEHKAILLRGDINSGRGHGELVLSYVKNGLFGSYGHCQVAMVRSDGTWRLRNVYTGRLVDDVAIETWALGIQKVKGICP